jgi:hypothetical protein
MLNDEWMDHVSSVRTPPEMQIPNLDFRLVRLILQVFRP